MAYWEDYWRRRRISRRSVLAGGAAFGAGTAGLVLTGCGGDDDDDDDDGETEGPTEGTDATEVPEPTATEDTGPKVGGILKTAGGRLTSFDPYFSGGHPQIYDGPFTRDTATLELQPNFVAETEVVDKNNYIFKMADNVHFHDLDPVNGRAATSADVVYSWLRYYEVADETILSPRTWNWIETVEGPDEGTVKLITNRPYAFTLDVLAVDAFSLIAQEAVEKFGDLKGNPLGTGPHQVESLEEEVRLVLRRQPNYHKPGIPYVDGWEDRAAPDGLALASLLKSGDIDYSQTSLLDPFTVRELLDSTPGLGEANFPTLRPYFYAFNVEAVPDVRAREACSLAMDYDRMIDEVHGGEGLYNGPITSGLAIWALPQTELRELQAYDPARAKALYEAAGSPEIVMLARTGTDINARNTDSGEAMILEAGINLKRDDAFTLDKVVGGDFGFLVSSTFSQQDPVGNGFQLQLAQGYNGLWNHNNDEVEALISQAEETFDAEELIDVIQKAQRIAIKDFVILDLPSGPTKVLLYERVKGLNTTSPNLHKFQTDLWLDT